MNIEAIKHLYSLPCPVLGLWGVDCSYDLLERGQRSTAFTLWHGLRLSSRIGNNRVSVSENIQSNSAETQCGPWNKEPSYGKVAGDKVEKCSEPIKTGPRCSNFNPKPHSNQSVGSVCSGRGTCPSRSSLHVEVENLGPGFRASRYGSCLASPLSHGLLPGDRSRRLLSGPLRDRLVPCSPVSAYSLTSRLRDKGISQHSFTARWRYSTPSCAR